MASQIVYDSIDVTFPVAGKDNDSQGFRDNFTVIHDNFQYAKGEIEALQLNNAVKNGPNQKVLIFFFLSFPVLLTFYHSRYLGRWGS